MYETVWESTITYHNSVQTHFENFRFLKIGLKYPKMAKNSHF